MAETNSALCLLEGREERSNVLGSRGDNLGNSGRDESDCPSYFSLQKPGLANTGYRHSFSYTPLELQIREWVVGNTQIREMQFDELYNSTQLNEDELREIDDSRKVPIIRAVNAIVRSGLEPLFRDILPYKPEKLDGMFDYLDEEKGWNLMRVIILIFFTLKKA